MSQYRAFIRFLWPLVLALFAQELSGQFVNGGMARLPRATETLAAFGLALGLMMILNASLYQSRQLGLVLVENITQLRRVTRSITGAGVAMSLATLMLGATSAGRWVVQDLHGVSESLATEAQFALCMMAPVPLLGALARYYSGTLARIRRTDIVSASSLTGIAFRIGSIFGFLNADFVAARPILLPIVATVSGGLAEYAVVAIAHVRLVRPKLHSGGEEISHGAIFRFFWPLAWIMMIQGLTRPVINLFVSRGSDATEALAVLTVVYALGHIHYGWLNETRSLAPAFKEEPDNDRAIRRFIRFCCVTGLGMGFLFYWTPLRDFILADLIGVPGDLIPLCVLPLWIFTFFPLPVSLRAYYHGLGLVHRQTRAMAPSGPARIAAATIALILLSQMDVRGATMGIGALFCGFCAEALTVRATLKRAFRDSED